MEKPSIKDRLKSIEALKKSILEDVYAELSWDFNDEGFSDDTLDVELGSDGMDGVILTIDLSDSMFPEKARDIVKEHEERLKRLGVDMVRVINLEYGKVG